MKLALVLLAAVVLAAAAPRPMAWSVTQRSLQVVEQQGNIVNPTDCAWDVDDRIDGAFTGVIGKGETVSHTECVILDQATHLVGLKVGDGLAGSISVSQPIGPTIGGSLAGTGCLLTPEYGDPEWMSLPAIGDGHGDRVAVTWSVTNISGHRLGRTQARTTLHLDTTDSRAEWGCAPIGG